MKNKSLQNAIYIGVLCSVTYLAVYLTKNILGAVQPQMLENGYTITYLGDVGATYLIAYAFGQLLNGAIGDKIKARYMISTGLFMAGIANILFALFAQDNPNIALIAYTFTGFFLSMIFGPITKTVSENTELVYATRCSIGYTFASFIGSPMAGILAASMVWQNAFFVDSSILILMAVICFTVFLIFEKKGIVKYKQFSAPKEKGGSVKILIKRRIIKFTFIAIITGIIRTSVVLLIATYLSQHLKYSSDEASSIFAIATFIISFTAIIAIFVYERLKRNMDVTILLMFSLSAIFFALVYFVQHPVLNIIFLVLAIMGSNGASAMLSSRYCPSLRDTGMVSTVAGFLDFTCYVAAAGATKLFPYAINVIGWRNLTLIWFVIMVFGVLVALPKISFNRSKQQ